MKVQITKFALVCVVLGIFSIAVTAQATESKKLSVADLTWFSGCWERSVPARQMTISEMWMKPEGGMLVGVSKTVVKGKTTAWEYLRVAETADGIDYIAKPSSKSDETSFRVKSFTAKEVIFENLQNDFPQRIIYRHDKSDELFARIEGTNNGKTGGIDFRMVRVKCE